MESRVFVTSREPQAIAADLEQWFGEEGMESQTVPGPGGVIIVQARDRATWKPVLGLNRATTVTLAQGGDQRVVATVGGGSWVDKAVVGGVSMFVLWPLIIPAAIGAVAQAQLPHRILDALATITRSEASFAQPTPQGHPALPHVLCPGCGQAADQGAHFCMRCGAKLPEQPGPCRACGAPLAHGMHFCPACGAPTNQPQASGEPRVTAG